jgi:hypothetical protein
MTSMATQNNPDAPGGVARVRVTASFRYSDTLIARDIDVRNWHKVDTREPPKYFRSAVLIQTSRFGYGESLIDYNAQIALCAADFFVPPISYYAARGCRLWIRMEPGPRSWLKPGVAAKSLPTCVGGQRLAATYRAP